MNTYEELALKSRKYLISGIWEDRNDLFTYGISVAASYSCLFQEADAALVGLTEEEMFSILSLAISKLEKDESREDLRSVVSKLEKAINAIDQWNEDHNIPEFNPSKAIRETLESPIQGVER